MKDLWIGGGYEQTHYWIDPKRGFVGTIMTQMFGPYDDKYAYSKITESEELFMNHGPKCRILKNNE